jgi:hypothetical protein
VELVSDEVLPPAPPAPIVTEKGAGNDPGFTGNVEPLKGDGISG